MLVQRLGDLSAHIVANTEEGAALVVVPETCKDSEGGADQVAV